MYDILLFVVYLVAHYVHAKQCKGLKLKKEVKAKFFLIVLILMMKKIFVCEGVRHKFAFAKAKVFF